MGPFSKSWFAKHQRILLRFANTLPGRIFLGIDGKKSAVGKNKIVGIGPNAIYWQGQKGGSFVAEFRTGNKFSNIIRHRTFPILSIFHNWDTLIANPIFPKLNLGFDSLSLYTLSGDGYIYTSPNQTTYSAARNGTSGAVADTEASIYSANKFVNPNYYVTRAFTPFDTSSLPDDATITDATYSLYVYSKGQSDAGQADIVVVQSTQASATLGAGDFDSLTVDSPAEGASRVSYAGITTGSYNDIALNSTGLGWISKTGNTYLVLRMSGDVDNLTPTGDATEHRYGASEDTGTSQDPRLVVSYSLSAYNGFSFFM